MTIIMLPSFGQNKAHVDLKTVIKLTRHTIAIVVNHTYLKATTRVEF